MPERYKVRYAASADDVLSELQTFIEYIKSGPVIAMLPSALHGISSQDAGEVAKWQEQIAKVRRKTCPLGAMVSFWLDLPLRDVHRSSAAAQRARRQRWLRTTLGRQTPGIAPDDVSAGDGGRSGVSQQRS
jgi:hypothetical protein